MARPNPSGVLRQVGLPGARVTRITRGLVNEHWRATAGADRWIVRRYNQYRAAASVRYEHAVLHHLAAREWPVAAPRATPSGETIVEVDGRVWSVFPHLPGRQRPLTADARQRGSLLARLHRDTRDLSRLGDRAGFGRLLDFDSRAGHWVDADPRGLKDVLSELAGDDPDLARDIAFERARLFEEVYRIGIGALPDTVLHGDFHGGNLLYTGREVTGILDFDFTHKDLRVADIAIAVGFLVDPRPIREFLAGYSSEQALDERELRLIGPLMRARGLEHIAFLLVAKPEWADADSVRRTLDAVRRERARGPDLESALLPGPSGP
jgi:homoserine kinase type II